MFHGGVDCPCSWVAYRPIGADSGRACGQLGSTVSNYTPPVSVVSWTLLLLLSVEVVPDRLLLERFASFGGFEYSSFGFLV